LKEKQYESNRRNVDNVLNEIAKLKREIDEKIAGRDEDEDESQN